MQTIDDARKTIDKVSKNLAKALAQTIEINEETEINIISIATSHAQKLIDMRKVPIDFINMIYLVSERLEQYAIEHNVSYENKTIEYVTNKLSERYNALAPIALDKANRGIKDAYVQERHETVITESGELALKYGADKVLLTGLTTLLADEAVTLQNPYLKHRVGPLAEIING